MSASRNNNRHRTSAFHVARIVSDCYWLNPNLLLFSACNKITLFPISSLCSLFLEILLHSAISWPVFHHLCVELSPLSTCSGFRSLAWTRFFSPFFCFSMAFTKQATLYEYSFFPNSTAPRLSEVTLYTLVLSSLFFIDPPALYSGIWQHTHAELLTLPS